MIRVAALGLALACTDALSCEGLEATNGWVRLPPPGMPMTAGYVRIKNGTGKDLTIDAVSSPDYGDVTLHRTVEIDGMSRMRPGLPLSVPAAGRQDLVPGGYHLMLSEPLVPHAEGAQVRMQFHCGGETVEVPFVISKDAP